MTASLQCRRCQVLGDDVNFVLKRFCGLYKFRITVMVRNSSKGANAGRDRGGEEEEEEEEGGHGGGRGGGKAFASCT